MEIPVYIYEEGVELPTEGMYYIVAGNGLFLRKDCGLIYTTIPVSTVAFIPDFKPEEGVGHRLAKIPADLLGKIVSFFHRVVQQYTTEAIVLLYYNEESKQYKLLVPEQIVSHGGIKYAQKALTHELDYQGFVPIGTVHSHCNFDAFHSGVDVHDEEDWDGLHITVGHNDKVAVSVVASVVVNGRRQPIDPETILEGIVKTGENYRPSIQSVDSEEIDAWMEKVHDWASLEKWQAIPFMLGGIDDEVMLPTKETVDIVESVTGKKIV